MSDSKTFGTITVFDVLYIPKIDEIEEVSVSEILRGRGGDTLTVRYYCSNSISVTRSMTSYIVDKRTTVFVNKAKAEVRQEVLRVKHLEYLRSKAEEATRFLTDFTNKYFIPKIKD